MTAAPASWTVVVPVKGTADGKSRMAPAIGPAERAQLVEAFALDAVAALMAASTVQHVIVVTDAAAELAAPLRRLGAEIVADPGLGLNAAIEAGIAAAAPHQGSSAGPGAVAALLGDLPCLVAADVDLALGLAAEHPLSLVPDAQGSGTTLITARPGVALVPRFGAGSAARHREAGHAVLDVPTDSTLRLDVDTEVDLEAARARGLGPRTLLATRHFWP